MSIDDKLHWYKDAIIYELHIKAFADGNGDGIGDFKGLMSKLDYIQELGVTAIWLLPFYPSPLRDDGYDIADYYTINPSYGNIAQFRQLLDEAHRRNLRIITELVINHSSDQHPWFQRARRAAKGSPERDYYVWSDDPTQWKDVRIIFTDYEASNWTWDPVAGQYYWHRFFHHQPDLNYDSPLVQDEVFKMLDYWCQMGVDGFRLDAVPYLFEREGTNGENLPETHVFLKKLRAHIDEKFPGTVFLAEANMWPEDSASYFGNGDECHMNYHFPVMPRMFMALQMEDRYPITDIFDQTPAIPENCQWAMFLRNHDELTLEMVTDEERDYMYKVYAKDPRAKINLGIRHRLAPLMGNNRRKIELMNCLLFSMPGTPVIYYGDEIGMGDNFYLGDRDGVRTPMQWNPDRNGGFSTANPQKLYLPVILDPEYNYEAVNVEMQQANTSSLFWFMKRMIAMRKKYKVFGRGDMKFINVSNPKVLAFTRSYQEQTLLVLVNLSKYSQPAEVSLAGFSGYAPIEVFSKNKFPVISEDKPYFFTLGTHAYEWFLLKNVNNEAAVKSHFFIQINEWKDIASEITLHELENNVLGDYISTATWYEGALKTYNSLRITNSAFIGGEVNSPVILLAELLYDSGLAESYQLPVAFVPAQQAQEFANNFPEGVIANIKMGDEDGILADALYLPEFRQFLFRKMTSGKVINLPASAIHFFTGSEVQKNAQANACLKSKLHTEDGFTSIHYDNGLLLKIYRKIDPTLNPDMEITRYLTEDAHFAYVPQFAGAILWKFDNDTIALGMLQSLVENHGNGYSFMLTRVNNYIERILSKDKDLLENHDVESLLSDPVGYEDLPQELQLALGSNASEHARLVGVRTGEMHKALAAGSSKEFATEAFSLHYQRSLFSSMQSQAREAFEHSIVSMQKLPEGWRQELEELYAKKEKVLNVLKRIYTNKLEVTKIRIHGNLHLGQVLLTGRDVLITDFGGDPGKTFSDRRLKRSPLRDVASMILSFRYAAYEGFLKTNHIPKDNLVHMLPYAKIWARYMSRFFMKGWLDTVAGSSFVPQNKTDLHTMLDVYMLEKCLFNLKYDLQNKPEMVIVPLRSIEAIIG